jgi:hypothetical protein
VRLQPLSRPQGGVEAFPVGGIDTDKINEGDFMARIIVTTDPTERPDAPVLLDEFVCPDHLSDHHSAAQLMERLGWAVTDAEKTQQADRAA